MVVLENQTRFVSGYRASVRRKVILIYLRRADNSHAYFFLSVWEPKPAPRGDNRSVEDSLTEDKCGSLGT